MIGAITDMLDQWRRRTGHLVGDNVYVSVSLVAKAASIRSSGKIIEIKPDDRKIGFVLPEWPISGRVAIPSQLRYDLKLSGS